MLKGAFWLLTRFGELHRFPSPFLLPVMGRAASEAHEGSHASIKKPTSDSIFWDLDLGSKFQRQSSEMTLPRGSVSDLLFSLKKSWELVCLRTARSL